MDELIEILIIDDVISSLSAVEKSLNKQGYHITALNSANAAKKILLERHFHVIVTDLKMPEADGKEILQLVKRLSPKTIVIIMTGYSSVESAVELMQEGAFSYIKKPIDIKELRQLIQKGLEQSDVKSAPLNAQNSSEILGSTIITHSKTMYDLLIKINIAAKSKSTILIEGESGTGKELISKYIHNASPRSNETFLSINCSAFTESNLENLLFGTEPNVFNTSVTQGLFEKADKGSLFLDEISDLTLAMQAKLLRVLETKEFARMGSTQLITSDMRIIAATNKNLMDEVKKNNFREDLYYRLSVINFLLPPLRDRKEDIPFLVKNFIEKLAKENQMSIKLITGEAMDLLYHYDWPGNIRELRNLVERLFITVPGKVINKKDVLSYIKIDDMPENDVRFSIGQSMFDIEKKAIIDTIRFTNGNRSKAAEILNISIRTLQRKLKEYNIN